MKRTIISLLAPTYSSVSFGGGGRARVCPTLGSCTVRFSLDLTSCDCVYFRQQLRLLIFGQDLMANDGNQQDGWGRV